MLSGAAGDEIEFSVAPDRDGRNTAIQIRVLPKGAVTFVITQPEKLQGEHLVLRLRLRRVDDAFAASCFTMRWFLLSTSRVLPKLCLGAAHRIERTTRCASTLCKEFPSPCQHSTSHGVSSVRYGSVLRSSGRELGVVERALKVPAPKKGGFGRDERGREPFGGIVLYENEEKKKEKLQFDGSNLVRIRPDML